MVALRYKLHSSATVALCHVAAVSDMMADDPELWQRRPLSSQLQQYAAADVSQLLSLADILASKLGEVGQDTVLALSQTNSQMKLPIKLGTQVPQQQRFSSNCVSMPFCGCTDSAATGYGRCHLGNCRAHTQAQKLQIAHEQMLP